MKYLKNQEFLSVVKKFLNFYIDQRLTEIASRITLGDKHI